MFVRSIYIVYPGCIPGCIPRMGNARAQAYIDIVKIVIPHCCSEQLYGLYTYQQWTRVPISLHPHQHLALSRKAGHFPLSLPERTCQAGGTSSQGPMQLRLEDLVNFNVFISFLPGLSPLPVMKVLFIIPYLVLTNGTRNLKPSSIILRTQPAFQN